jgi:hypothetical protein
MARRTVAHRGLVSLIVAVAAGALLPLGGPTVRAGGGPDVPITSLTTVSVVPERNVVVVAVDATLTSHVPDTTSVTYYVNDAFLSLLPGAMNLKATGPGAVALSVTVDERTDAFVVARIQLSSNLFSGESYRFRLTYELPGVGPSAAPFTHADESFVAFPVWAHSTPHTLGNQVVVVIPPGYEIGVTFGDLPEPATGAQGEAIYDFGDVPDADAFWAFFSAKRYAALATDEIRPRVGEDTVRVLLRGWADDPAWLTEVAPVMEDGLPTLAELIGLPYPGLETLYVDETVSWLIAGYAGVYDASRGTIEVSELADPFVILHEAAHTWFNSGLVSDRWIAEGFADYYAAAAADALGIPTENWTPEQPPTEAFPLARWPPLDRADNESEPYGYAASQWAAYLIGQRVGADGLAEVWSAVADHQVAYQPAHGGTERSGLQGTVDAQELLDQLEERTGERMDDIWLAWVLPAEEVPELRQRSASRAAYAALVDLAGPWNLPIGLRREMDEWQFEAAEEAMNQARVLLERAETITHAASAMRVDPPEALQDAFEAGDWEAAKVEATGQLLTLRLLTAAQAALDDEPDVLERLGFLLSSDFDSDLRAAGDAYEADDLWGAIRLASAVAVGRSDAAERGVRLIVSLALIVGMSLWLYRSRWRPDLSAPAAPIPVSTSIEGPTAGRPAGARTTRSASAKRSVQASSDVGPTPAKPSAKRAAKASGTAPAAKTPADKATTKPPKPAKKSAPNRTATEPTKPAPKKRSQT